MTRCGSLSALFLMLIFGFAASAETVHTPNWARDWEPRLTFGVLAQQQRGETRVESSLFTRTPVSLTPDSLDISRDSSNFTVALMLGVEVLGPALGDGAAAPRPFLGVAYQATPFGDRDFLADGTVNSPDSPTALPGAIGQGALLGLEQHHQWRASAGLTVPYQILDSPVHLRGSFDYFGQRLEVEGTVVGVDSGLTEGTVFELNWNETEIFHFIGPRLGIEAEVGRRGPLRIIGFADVAGYFRLGDAGVEASTRVGPETGRFLYEADSFIFQGGLGIRIAWDPAGG